MKTLSTRVKEEETACDMKSQRCSLLELAPRSTKAIMSARPSLDVPRNAIRDLDRHHIESGHGRSGSPNPVLGGTGVDDAYNEKDRSPSSLRGLEDDESPDFLTAKQTTRRKIEIAVLCLAQARDVPHHDAAVEG